MVPLVSWVAPANVYEGQFLVPSLRHCERRWSWWPRYVVGDMAFLPAAIKGECRRQWQVAVLTKLRTGMNRIEPFVTSTRASCRQEQPLTWLGYDTQAQEHYFGVTASEPLCSTCWEASRCPREFVYPAGDHETLLGVLPLFTTPAQRMLKQMRSWIEPAQSYEKNQLGLNQMFLNSLRLTWWMALLADAACLLRASALLDEPPSEHYLQELLPEQLSWNWS